MSVLTIVAIFVLSLVVSFVMGTRWTYVLIYLPTMILLNQVPALLITHVPINAEWAPLYAILIATPFRGESIRFKFGVIDLVVVLLLLSATVTGWTTEVFETGVNVFRTDLMRLVLPYFLARIVFKDWAMRRATVYVLAGVMAVVGVAALIEVRLTPYFYLHLLQAAGMGNTTTAAILTRYGYFRVSGPVDQPIFFGNMCVVILGMVAVLARTSGMRLLNPVVALTLLSAVGCVAVSISFTPYVGVIAGSVGMALLMTVPLTRRLVLPATIAVFIAGFAYTAHAATTDLGVKGDTQLEGSFYTRNKIIQESWKLASTAGPFGYGLRADFSAVDEDFDLLSVDNTYMQFAMTRGWVYTALWCSLGILFAWRVGRAFGRVTDPAQLFPLAVSTATILALMVSMYTVFAGALYAVVWIIMLGLSNTLIDAVDAAADAREAQGQASVTRLRPPTVRMPAIA